MESHGKLMESPVYSPPVFYAVKNHRLQTMVYPEQNPVIANPQLVKTPQIGRKILHGSTCLVGMIGKPGQSL